MSREEMNELLYLADQQALARARYNEDDADLIRESKVIEWALRRAACSPPKCSDLRGPLQELIIAFQDHPSSGIQDTIKRARTALSREEQQAKKENDGRAL